MADENSSIFLATLGQRPQAITMALDWLRLNHDFCEVVIIHTDAKRSGITRAYEQLMQVLETDYSELQVKSWELCFPDGVPITDIQDLRSAEAYSTAVFEVLQSYRALALPLHLLVAGGRKAMSIYAMLAATYVLGEHDHVWTILTPDDLMNDDIFHIPPGRYQDVHLVNMPILPSGQLPEVIKSRSRSDILTGRRSPRSRFLAQLTKQENALIEALRLYPHGSTRELSEYLGKSEKTVENQFGHIYIKLSGFYDVDVPAARKRQVLLDVIHNRV